MFLPSRNLSGNVATAVTRSPHCTAASPAEKLDNLAEEVTKQIELAERCKAEKAILDNMAANFSNCVEDPAFANFLELSEFWCNEADVASLTAFSKNLNQSGNVGLGLSRVPR